ncbi:Rne/Rng family ribonuclease [Alloacidobacterium sp.]|uniref:Rne/Rng family ribonuclease n=1 Tax=Alloacidobacterium sp. TaxID=2951999 RepID=UPI002D31EFB8|nr:Rne/Rng family ribonuclease [Alloacidobacterium sp.]HYK35653.1 Rne/Rng family ribonuclease [Alloacidobacterium sp.]
MSKEICISSTPHETRLAILEDDQLAEIYYERENEYTLAGSIYKGRVTRVLPGMQSAFVDLGLERDAFLYVTDFLEEQEDSADFERIGGPQQPQREQRRTAQPAHEEESERAEETHAREQDPNERSPEGTRRWRGRRGRRGRDGRPQHSREGNSHIESPEAIEESISAEPIILPEHGAPGGIPASSFAAPPVHVASPTLLPGESLSKYGGQPAANESKASIAAAPVKTSVTSRPSTLIEGPIDWDGGLLLPGESRSRCGRREEAGVPAGEAAAVVPPVPAVNEEEAREAFPEAAEPESAVEAVVKPEHEVLPESAVAEAAPVVHEADTHPETVEEVHEYEPEHASASHRVDAAAPSEYRLSSAVEEPALVEEAAHVAEPDHETQHESTSVTETVAEEAATPTVSEPAFSVEYQEEETAEQPAEAAGTAPAEVETDSENDRKFAPGTGLLEEEVIDEEEYDFEPIHAHADEHDLEELEEQTIDHAINGADLGAIVRDMHINQRLNFGPEGALAEQAAAEEEQAYAEELDEGEELEEAGEDEVSADAQASPEQSEQEGRRQDYRDRRRSGRGRHGRRRPGGGPRRASAQVTDLPVITELLKPGQEILVQIAKEPIAKKGARITSHIALPGRFLVFMPTVNHVGVSRKISSDEERQRLKRILISEKGTAAGGFIVRTAAASASEDELRADLRFLISLWNDIKQRSDDGKAPALIYHDLNLVERVMRDQVSDNFSTIWVDSETEYERVVRFLNRFQPSLVRRVKLYTKETPLFEQFGIQDEITKALRSKVWLKSGGSIVINQTEALVAIDINTGKYVGKTARLEDTILKTNLDAIPEIVRQIRLRDLGGIIVIDFIDMDERKNRHKVMQALEEALKADRAPSKVLQFNDFGLVAITRKRVKQSLERTLSVPCEICQGTGMVKSPMTVCNEIYIEMRKMQKHLERNDVLLRVHPEVVKTLKANNARWLNEMEEMISKTIIVKSDPALHPEQFDIH